MRTRYSLRRQHQETGSVAVLVALSMVALLGFAALAIDVAHVHQQQRDMQSATDAAAMAGVTYLTNFNTQSSAIPTALAIAETNGVSLAQIQASNVGTIEVGTWNTNATPPSFAAGSSVPCSNCNAVLVSAKRSVSLAFGQVVGFGQMAPTAQSVAMLTGANGAYGGPGGLVPFIVLPTQATNAFYQQYSFSKGDISDGAFGPLDFSGVDGGNGWAADMETGCNCSIDINQFISNITGNSGIKDAWTTRLADDPFVILPVTDSTGPGNSQHGVVITGFVAAKLISVTGNGNGNWTVTLENIPMPVGGGTTGNGTNIYSVGLARVLVQ
jgi:Flp pilus assembly protein TadG